MDSKYFTALPRELAPAELAQRWARCQRSGEVFETEYRFRSKSGEYRWMLGRGLPSRDEQGHIMQWIGTCTDIHEHKLALTRIDQARRQLQENNAQLTRANVTWTTSCTRPRTTLGPPSATLRAC